jgi:hypothetical protein
MAEICRFYGIVIVMNSKDHNPPHFLAKYQDQKVSIESQTDILQGKIVLDNYSLMCYDELQPLETTLKF